MFTQTQLLKKAIDYIESFEKEVGLKLIILKEFSIEKNYGTIFFYTSEKYFQTRDDKYGIAGNSPFLVENKTGKIIEFGTARREEYYIKEYEAGRWPIK